MRDIDYSKPENIKKVGDMAMQGALVGLVFDNERKLQRFLLKLLTQFPEVELVDKQPMAKSGPMKDCILARVRKKTP